MKHSRLFISLAAATALAGAGQVFAGEAQPQAAPNSPTAASADEGAPDFNTLDTQHRGYIVRADIPKDVPALKQLRAHFNEADLNHDGHVSGAEYNSYVTTVPAGQHKQ
jgi:hypothetical protein